MYNYHKEDVERRLFFLLQTPLFSYNYYMKFFSAFDSNHKYEELAEAQKEFGEDKVLLITKSDIHYIVWFIIPAIIVITTWVWLLIVWLKYADENWWKWSLIGMTIAASIILLIIWYNSYIHYKLIFMIITPEKVDIYNQLSLTHRNVKSIFVQEISGVYIDKNWLRNSIVNNWDITIESEENPHTKVHFWPIARPDRLKKKVEDIIEKLLTQERKPLRQVPLIKK